MEKLSTHKDQYKRQGYRSLPTTTINLKNIINMNCDLGYCDEFTKCIITDEGTDDGLNDELIHFSVYTYQGRF